MLCPDSAQDPHEFPERIKVLFFALLSFFYIVKLCIEQAKSLLLVLKLTSLLVALDYYARGLVCESYCRLGLIDMLTACAAGFAGFDLKVGGIDIHLNLLDLREHRHRYRRRVDPALGFRLRNTLNAMHAAFKF